MSSPLRRVGVLAAQVTGGFAAAIIEDTPVLRTLADLPGPVVEDAEAYNARNHHYLTELHEKYGDMISISRSGDRLVLVRRPDLVKRVLLDEDDFNKTWNGAAGSSQTVDYVMNLIQPVLRQTIFNMHGEDNRMRRAALRSTFLGTEEFAAASEPIIASAVAAWPTDQAVDIQDLCHDLTRKCMLLVCCGDIAEDTFFCLPVFHDVMNYFVQRYAADDHLQTVDSEDDRQMGRLEQAAAEVVKLFLSKFDASQSLSPITKRSVLANCVKARLSEEEMSRTLVNVLIAAGEAPASGLAQTLEHLASSSDMQEKLREEARRASKAGSYAGQLEQLPWSASCIQEGMRVFAPATLVTRVAMHDTFLDDVHIPKGTVVGVCTHSVHANEKIWVDARRFNPMRKDLDYETSEGYVAFGGGPRGCPGKHVAMAICKVALPLIVSRFDLACLPKQQPSKNCKKVPKFVEWNVDGIPLQLVPAAVGSSRF